MNPIAKLRAMSKKGNFAMQSPVVAFILGFFGVGIIAAIYVIVLAALKDTTTDADALSVIGNTTTLFKNFTLQFGTIGTVAGVLLLVVLIALVGVGGYMLYQRNQR